MNKDKIKELMQRAGTDTSGKWMGVEHAEVFAELIVRECMCKIMQQKEEAIHVRVDEAMSAALLDISELFGVE